MAKIRDFKMDFRPYSKDNEFDRDQVMKALRKRRILAAAETSSSAASIHPKPIF